MKKTGNVFYLHGKKYNCYINGNPRFRLSETIAGKRRQVYGDGEKDAQRKLEELKKKAASGLDLNLGTAKFGPTMRFWLFNIKRIDKDIKASSFARYESAFRNHIENKDIARVTLASINTAVMQAYIASLYEIYGLSVASIKNVIKIAKMFFIWAVNEGYTVKNPMSNLTIPGKRDKAQKVLETFTAEERKLLSDYMDESGYQYDTLIRLAFATGMRKGELLALRWSDIEDNVITISRSTAVVTHVDKEGNRERYREVWDPKTENAYREIPLNPETAAMLKQHQIDQAKYFLKSGIRSEYVFTTMAGELIDSSSLSKSFNRLQTRAGIRPRKFHAIRHTFATEAIRAGVDVKDLQMIMGHSDIETTYQYVHPNIETKVKAMKLIGSIM